MYRVQTLNKIALKGLEEFDRDHYDVAGSIVEPDAIIVRSSSMHELELSDNVKAIARAGAGVNNIPIDKCTENGIVVFNTPGANANAVKELVLAALFMSSRRIMRGMDWVRTLKCEDCLAKTVETGKKNFAGCEIKGKTLGVIGLGAIGVMVANDAEALGMKVIGYDPYISVEAAWNLSSSVQRAISLDSVLANSDFITIHVPLVEATKNMINAEKLAIMKDGAKILNFSREGLVNSADVLKALQEKKIDRYVTDFPTPELLCEENVVCLPHLGASTAESEENCAVMAVKQVKDFLENGNIKNSVNFPACYLARSEGATRLLIANRNEVNMVAQIATLLASNQINILDMINKNKGDLSYNIININNSISAEIENKIKEIDGVLMVRVI